MARTLFLQPQNEILPMLQDQLLLLMHILIMRKFPHPRSEEAIIALAKFRGSSSGFNLAEAFEVIREIKD